RPRVEDHDVGRAAEAIDLGLVDHLRAARRELEQGRGLELWDLGRESVALLGPRTDPTVEHAPTGMAEAAQEPPAARGDGTPGVVVGNDDAVLGDADAR